MLEAISITQARRDFLPFIERIDEELYKFIVTKHGKPVAVVLSYEEYSRMVETLKLIEDEKLTQEIKQGLTEIGQEKLVLLTDINDDE